MSDGSDKFAIKIRGLSHYYRRNDGSTTFALKNINLKIPQGQFIAIVGPSGSGKSTLLNLIAGLIKPSNGKISIEDAPVSIALRAKRLAMVFQDPVLLPWRDTLGNIQLPLELAGMFSEDAVTKAKEQVRLVMLEGFERSYPKELSGGMRSRVAIARALVLSPSILLMDEPFGSLDEITAYNLNMELLRIWEDRKPTIVFVTHSISQAVFLSDRVLVFSPRPGHIVGDISITLQRPRTPDTLSSKNFVDLNIAVRRSLNLNLVINTGTAWHTK
jgi:NitT/TauT family transport system ATP-binding protein